MIILGPFSARRTPHTYSFMTDAFENQHPRSDTGAFTDKPQTAPEVEIRSYIPATPEDLFDRDYIPVPPPSGEWLYEVNELEGIDVNRIWTVVDGDGDSQYICAGRRLVNRFGYLVTENPWTDPNIEFKLDGIDGEV